MESKSKQETQSNSSLTNSRVSGVAGSVRLVTDNGLLQSKDLYEVGSSTTVSVSEDVAKKFGSGMLNSSSSVCKVKQETPIYIKTESGRSITLSEDHKLHTADGWKTVSNLDEGNEVKLLDHQGVFGEFGTYDEGVMNAMICQNQSPKFEENMFTTSIDNISHSASPEVKEIREWVYSMQEYEDAPFDTSNLTCETIKVGLEYTSIDESEVQDVIPRNVFMGCKQLVRGFIQGVMEIRGNIKTESKNEVKVELYCDERHFAEELQLLLLNFGVNSSIDSLPEESHRIQLTGENIVTYIENIGVLDHSTDFANELHLLLDEYGSEMLQVHEEYRDTIVSIEEKDDPINLYTILEPKTLSYISNGFVSQLSGV